MKGQKEELTRTKHCTGGPCCSRLLLELGTKTLLLFCYQKELCCVLTFKSTALEVLQQECLGLDVDRKPSDLLHIHLGTFPGRQVQSQKTPPMDLPSASAVAEAEAPIL